MFVVGREALPPTADCRHQTASHVRRQTRAAGMARFARVRGEGGILTPRRESYYYISENNNKKKKKKLLLTRSYLT